MQNRSLVSAFLSAAFLVTPFAPVRGQVFQQERSIEEITGIRTTSTRFSARWNNQSEEERQLARQKTKDAMKAQYQVNPQAFAFHYVAATNPGEIDKLRGSLEDYQDDGKLKINPSLAVTLSLSLKKMPQFLKKYVDAKAGINFKVGGSAQDVYDYIPDADNPYLVADDQATKDFFTDHPEAFDAAVDVIIGSREEQRLFEGPVISQEGSPIPDPKAAEFYTDVSNVFGIPDLKPLVSTDDHSSDPNDSHQAECNASLEAQLPGKSLDQDTYLKIVKGEIPPENVQEALGLSDEDIAKLTENVGAVITDKLRAHQQEQDRLAAEKEEERKQSKEYRLTQHRNRLAKVNAEARGAVNIIALFDPKLASDISTATTALTMIYDGVEVMSINNAMNLAAMGTVAGGVGLAMQLLGPKSSGPTPEEQIMKGIQAIIKLQQATLKRLDQIEGKVDRLQDDVSYLIELSEKSFEDLRKDTAEIIRRTENIQERLTELRNFTRELAVDEVIRDTNTDGDVVSGMFGDPNSPFWEDYDGTDKEWKDIPDDLKGDYRNLWRHLSRVVSAATNNSTINSATYVESDDIATQRTERLESELDLPVEKRAGMLPAIAGWLNSEARSRNITDRGEARVDLYRDTGHPGLFTDVFLPNFHTSSQWYYDHSKLSNQTAQLRDQFNLVAGAAAEARANIPLALTVYAHASWDLLQAYYSFMESRRIDGIDVHKHSTDKSIQDVLQTFNQPKLLSLARGQGLIETDRVRVKDDTHNVQYDAVEYYEVPTGGRREGDGSRMEKRNVVKNRSVTRRITGHFIKPTSKALREFPIQANQLNSVNPPHRVIEHHARYIENNLSGHRGVRSTGHIGSPGMHYQGRGALKRLIAASILDRGNKLAQDWGRHIQKPQNRAVLDRCARSIYALKTLIMVGYGNNLGTHADFEAPTRLLDALPRLTGSGSITNPGNLKQLKAVTDDMRTHQDRFDHRTYRMPANDDLLQEHGYLGFGNLNRAAILLHNLP